MSNANHSHAPEPDDAHVAPIPTWKSALVFAIPGVLIYLGTYHLVPLMVDAGIDLIWSWTLALFVPYQLLAAGLVIRHLRQPGHDWQTFCQRFRFRPIPRSDWKWMALGFWAVWGVVAVLGEEIIWRGYLLPRMEKTHGAKAWLFNGLFWNLLFHLYTLYNTATDLPFMLVLPYLAQRTKSTWTSFILHLALVWMGFALLIPGVFGAGS